MDGKGNLVEYVHRPNTHTLERIKQGVSSVLLTHCTAVEFKLYRDDIAAKQLEATTIATNPAECKVVGVAWTCTQTLRGVTNYEPLEGAKILLRN